jgi:hypothetical protein
VKRRALNLLTALSLVLCAASVALTCARKRVSPRGLQWTTPYGGTWFVGTDGGGVYGARQWANLPAWSDWTVDTRSFGTVQFVDKRGRKGPPFPLPRYESRRFGVRSERASGWIGYSEVSLRRIEATPAALIPALSALPALWIGRIGLRRWRRLAAARATARAGRCASCGYDLRATRRRCPECGAPFHAPRRGVREGDVVIARFGDESEARLAACALRQANVEADVFDETPVAALGRRAATLAVAWQDVDRAVEQLRASPAGEALVSSGDDGGDIRLGHEVEAPDAPATPGQALRGPGSVADSIRAGAELAPA